MVRFGKNGDCQERQELLQSLKEISMEHNGKHFTNHITNDNGKTLCLCLIVQTNFINISDNSFS